MREVFRVVKRCLEWPSLDSMTLTNLSPRRFRYESAEIEMTAYGSVIIDLPYHRSQRNGTRIQSSAFSLIFPGSTPGRSINLSHGDEA